MDDTFDKIPHARLLSHMEVEGNYYNGLKIFYQIKGNNLCAFNLCESKSDWINISGGVPQGSILCLFWFIVYVI